MKKSFFIISLFFISLIAVAAEAAPIVSFTWSSVESKTVLSPNINNDVTHYHWIIQDKNGDNNSETSWVEAEDLHDHITYLEQGTYFVKIIGKNSSSGETNQFTDQVKVSVTQEYIEPEEQTPEEEQGSKILKSLPEPLKSFFMERNQMELLLFLFLVLLILAYVSRRKKKKVFIEVKLFNESK